jgi:alpha-L-arabinofuranosidase
VDPNDIVVQAQIQGSTTSSEGVVYILTAGTGINPSIVRNTIDNPNAVSIITKPVSDTDGKFSITVLSWSVVVVTL